MKRLLGIFLLIGLNHNGFAQNKVQKVQAFFTVSVPGMQRADRNGNKINPDPVYSRFIMLECRFDGRPGIDSVYYNGIAYKAKVADKEETEAKVGIRKADGKPVMMAAKKGNHVWRIEVVLIGAKPLTHESVKKIQVKGKLDKIKFTSTIATETELTTPDMY